MNTMGKIIRGPCVYKPAKWDSAHLSGALNHCFLSNICSEKQIKPRIYFYLRTAHYQANIIPNFHGLFCQQRKWFNVENDLSSSAVEVLAMNSFQTSSCCVFQARYKLHQQNLSNGLAHLHSFFEISNAFNEHFSAIGPRLACEIPLTSDEECIYLNDIPENYNKFCFRTTTTSDFFTHLNRLLKTN